MTNHRRTPPVLVNQSFASQRVTGQQRYATEIASRLLRRSQFAPVAPSSFWAAATLRTWVWLQTMLPWLARRSLVLSMTARAPLWRRRHVLVVHDLFVLTNPEWFSRLYYWTHAPLLKAQLRSAAAIVAVSQTVADQVATRYRGPVVVAPNAPSAVFRATDDSVTALDRLGLEPGRYLLAVGSMDPRKNLRRLADAYARLSEADRRAHPLVVVGGGSSVFKQEDLVWPEGTVDAGYVTDEELRQLYRYAGPVVMASLAEGFGLPLVEAAAAGARNLVISDIPVFRWICGETAHYFDPQSVDSIAAALEAALQREPSSALDLDRFDWDHSADTVGELCCTVAGIGWDGEGRAA
jgi:glycosyltransferase involved in cell wall biosynthesis